MESGKIKIGGALMIKSLAEHKDWILEGQRDIEETDNPCCQGYTPWLYRTDWHTRPLHRREFDRWL